MWPWHLPHRPHGSPVCGRPAETRGGRRPRGVTGSELPRREEGNCPEGSICYPPAAKTQHLCPGGSQHRPFQSTLHPSSDHGPLVSWVLQKQLLGDHPSLLLGKSVTGEKPHLWYGRAISPGSDTGTGSWPLDQKTKPLQIHARQWQRGGSTS
jgi:hypothetical protein